MNFGKGIAVEFVVVVVLLCMEFYDFRVVSGDAVVRCVESEREALLRFKKGLKDESGILWSWGSEEIKKDCCKWKGVVCSTTNTTTFAHVISLLLAYDYHPYNQELGGKISDALLELHHLTVFDLSNNLFDDEFPEFIGSMKQLKHLNLENCFLGGTVVIVPPQIGNLTNLRTLDLSRNSLRSEDLNWLSHLSLLTRLDLSDSFDLSHTSWLPQILKLRSLQELDLSGSNIGGVIPAGALSANSSLESLSILDLSINEFTSSNLNWLFNISTSLAEIRMNENELDGQIPHVFGRFIFLEDLDLSYNTLEGDISESLGNLSHLQSLYLTDNQLTGFLGLELFSALRGLDLRNNKLVGAMPEGLSQLSLLEQVDVSHNSLEGTISEAYFTKLHNLQWLDLSFNSLTLQIAQDWSPPFQLDIIKLAGCKMNPHFPKWVQTQRNVRMLDLSNAGISDEVPKWLWSFSPSLWSLNISHNHITGTFPHLLPPSIEDLDVSSNKLSGPLPLLHESVSTILLNQNMFSGSISSVCSVMTVGLGLLALDLSDNQLGGEIPNCWENTSDLRYLNLGDNNFSGEVPQTLGILRMLVSLRLRGNNLSGELPSTLENCNKLTFIDVGGNKLTGNIPSWIGANADLMYVILRHNGFYGSIPREICNLTYIQVLDLSRNNISGEIPDCFNNLTTLCVKNATTPNSLYIPLIRLDEYASLQWKGVEFDYKKILGLLKLIDLSSNRLVGSIPASFSSMRALLSLNLSGNNLTGTIISDIGQMEMLEVLDLSRNQLSGHIPISLTQLHFLAVVDLANNDLSGKIPPSAQLQSRSASDYAGNDQLCGLPLKLCPEDVPNPPFTDQGKSIKKDGGNVRLSFMQEVAISITLGFIVGFWGVVGTLFLKKSWRYAYFSMFDEAKDWLCNATATLFKTSTPS